MRARLAQKHRARTIRCRPDKQFFRTRHPSPDESSSVRPQAATATGFGVAEEVKVSPSTAIFSSMSVIRARMPV